MDQDKTINHLPLDHQRLIADVPADTSSTADSGWLPVSTTSDAAASGWRAGELPRVEGYKVSRLIGQGGMGSVWEATELSTNRIIALKLLSGGAFGSDVARGRFEREVNISARVNHPNIAHLYHSGVYQGVYFYAMELIDGIHLDQYVKTNQLGHQRTLQIMHDVCMAIDHAQKLGVVHRDLKPSNILVTQDGKPHVLDFGLAKSFSGPNDFLTLSKEGGLLGTLPYMSPEQASGKQDQIDIRSDVYSLGVILYKLLLGEFPHEITGNEFDIQKRIVEDEPKRPRKIDVKFNTELETLLLKALAKEPENRYATAGALAEDIQNYLTGDLLNAQPLTAVYYLKKRVTKYRRSLLMGAATLMLLTSAFAFAYTQYRFAGKHATSAMIAQESADQGRYISLIEQVKEEIERDHVAQAMLLLNQAPKDQRHWEWNYLHKMADQSVMTLEGLKAHPAALQASVDGKTICAADIWGGLYVWDAVSGELVSYRPGKYLDKTHAVFDPTGQTVCLTNGKTIEYVETLTGRLIRSFVGHREVVEAIALRADGSCIASADFSGMIKLWNLKTGDELKSISTTSLNVVLTFSPSGLLAVGTEKKITFIDPDATEQVNHFYETSGQIETIVFSPDGQKMAVGTDEPKIIIWNTKSKQVACTLNTYFQGEEPFVFSFDGSVLLNANKINSRMDQWDTSTGKLLLRWRGHQDPINCLVLSPSTKQVISASKDLTIKLWDRNQSLDKHLIYSIDPHNAIFVAAFDTTGTYVAAGHMDGTISLWNRQTNQHLQWPAHDNLAISLVFNHDSSKLISVANRQPPQIWDLASQKSLTTLEGQFRGFLGTAYSSNQQEIVYAGRSATAGVRIHDATNGQLRFGLEGCWPIAFSHDGKQLVSARGVSRNQLVAWHVNPWYQTKVLMEVNSPIVALSSNNDGTAIALALADGTVGVYKTAEDGSEKFSILPESNAKILSLALSKDGTRLVTTGRSLILWHVDQNKKLLDLAPDTNNQFLYCAFTNNDQQILASTDRTIHQWNVQLGNDMVGFPSHQTLDIVALPAPQEIVVPERVQ